MKKIERATACLEVDQILRERKKKRRLRNEIYLDLMKYSAQIFSWANCPGASKRVVQELVQQHFGVTVSCDRIYRFTVCKLGSWPNSRKYKHGEKNA